MPERKIDDNKGFSDHRGRYTPLEKHLVSKQNKAKPPVTVQIESILTGIGNIGPNELKIFLKGGGIIF